MCSCTLGGCGGHQRDRAASHIQEAIGALVPSWPLVSATCRWPWCRTAQLAELEGITPEAHRLLAWRCGWHPGISCRAETPVTRADLDALSILSTFAPESRCRLTFCPSS